MLGLNRRSVNEDNCRGDEYGGRVAAAGRRLKEEDLGLSVGCSDTLLLPRQCNTTTMQGKVDREDLKTS